MNQPARKHQVIGTYNHEHRFAAIAVLECDDETTAVTRELRDASNELAHHAIAAIYQTSTDFNDTYMNARQQTVEEWLRNLSDVLGQTITIRYWTRVETTRNGLQLDTKQT